MNFPSLATNPRRTGWLVPTSPLLSGGPPMALVDGGALVARAIKQEGVDTIFTLCGGHVQAIYDSCLDENIRVIDVRHEQVAGHAAEGWSRATRRRGPAFLEIPTDVLFRKVEENDVYFPQSYRPQGRVYPDPKVIKQAAEIIAKAERPLARAGSALYWQDAHQELRHFVEVAQAPVYLNAMGRGAINQDHPLFFSRTRRNALSQADAIVVIGTPMDFRLSYGKRFNPEARTVQVDTDPQELARNRDIDVPIEGDAKAALEALLGELSGYKADHQEWTAGLRAEEEKVRAQMEEWMNSDRVPI